MTVEGIIISLTPYKESGAIVNIITKENKISFNAPNIYKIDKDNLLLTTPLMKAKFTFKESNKKFLTYKEMLPILDTRIYMNDIQKLTALNFINEVLLKILSEEEYPKIYELLSKTLDALNNVNAFSLCLIFLANALKYSGNALNVDSCVITGSQFDIVAISYVDGGLISRNAYKANIHKRYTPNMIHLLREIFKMKPSYLHNVNYERGIVKEIFNDLLIYTYDQTGVKLKSAKMIEKIL